MYKNALSDSAAATNAQTLIKTSAAASLQGVYTKTSTVELSNISDYVALSRGMSLEIIASAATILILTF